MNRGKMLVALANANTSNFVETQALGWNKNNITSKCVETSKKNNLDSKAYRRSQATNKENESTESYEKYALDSEGSEHFSSGNDPDRNSVPEDPVAVVSKNIAIIENGVELLIEEKTRKRLSNKAYCRSQATNKENKSTASYEEDDLDSEVSEPFSADNDPDWIEDPVAVVLENNATIEDDVEPVIEENTKKRLSRKRNRDARKWVRNERKEKLNRGREHKTKSGKIKAQRCLKTPCGEKCKLKCTEKVTVDQREIILQAYWSLGDITRQRDFISKCLCTIDPKYRYPKPDNNRCKNMAYHFEVGKKRIRVCKIFFLATLNISSMMIRTLLKKTNDSIVQEDRRGKHANHIEIDPEIKNAIRQHIESIPKIESHYLRNQTTRDYIDGSLNLSTLYRMYKEKCRLEDKPFAKQHLYASIFNSEYNIGLFQLKKDQCSVCEGFKNSNEKELKKEEYDQHLTDKDFIRAEKGRDVENSKDNDNQIVICFDIQAVLQTPCGEVNAFYYKRKLSVYNFTIYNITSKLGYCYFWSENIANRGANEMSSFIYDYLLRYCQGKEIIIYSDNCAAQNKNKLLAAMYLYAVNTENVTKITHKYLITGHTQNEGDCMHSCIEKEKKRMLRSGPIYVPSQWIPIIALSKKNGSPYKIKEIQTSDVFNWKKVSDCIGKNYTISTEGNKINWNDIKILETRKSDPSSLFVKTEFGSEFEEIDVHYKQKGRKKMQLKSS